MTLPAESENKFFKNYFYNKQLVNYIVNFMAIFTDMKVKIGINPNDQSDQLIPVPIRYGNVDRQVNDLLASYTQNKPVRLPLFSAELVSLKLRPEQQKGISAEQRKTFLPLDGTFPNDLQVVRSRVATPYEGGFELSLYTSNLDQKFQIIEQITSLFDPIVQFQLSDNPFSPNRINELKLEDMTFEKGSDDSKRILITTFLFSTTIWMQLPITFKQDFVKSVFLRVDSLTEDAISQVSDDINPYINIIDSENGQFYTK